MFFHFLLNAFPYQTITVSFHHKGHQFKVLMRPIQKRDRKFLDLTYGNADAMKTYMNGTVRSQEEISRRFARYVKWTRDKNVPWVHMLAFVISAPQSTGLKKGDFIGEFMIEPDDRNGEHFAELSYVLRPAVWGKGFGTHCAKSLLDLTIPHLKAFKMPRIEATARADNLGSVKILEKNGFRLEKTIASVHSAEIERNSAPLDRLLYVRQFTSSKIAQ